MKQHREKNSARASVHCGASLFNHAHLARNISIIIKRGTKEAGQTRFTHDLKTSEWRLRKNGMLRCGGSSLDLKKHSSNLLLEGSACFSVGHSRCNLATARATTSTSSYCADWGGSSALSPFSSSEDDSLSAVCSPWTEETTPSERASEPGGRSAGSRNRGRRKGLARLYSLREIHLRNP